MYHKLYYNKQYAALNKNYGDEINALYASYYDTIGSGKEMLTPSEFAEQYRAGKPKASNKEVARAYTEYVENNSVDDSESAASPSLDLDTEESTSHSVKDIPYGVERNEYSEKLDQKVVSAIDALAKLFHLKVRFGDLGGNNGLYHADTGLIELDIDPQHSGASNGFLFSVSHEIGHAVKERIGAKAWEEFADYAVKAKNGEKTIKAKQESAAEYSEYAVAREEVVCDFIGELLSEQKTLDTFCESIKEGEIKAETARGIVAAWRKITGILRGKGVKQTDTATAALVQRVQEQFGTDIETAENAVRKMQKALSAAMKAETQNKNATETGDDIRHSLKDAMKIGFDKLIKQFFDKKISRANPIFISNAPKNAEAMFKTNVPFIISSSDMTKSTRENNGSSRSAHALSRTFIEHLPQNIEESVIGYLENRNGVNSFTFVCFDEESNSLVAVGGALNVLYEGQTVNRVLSIFHISTPESFLTKSGKDLVTTDIEKAKNILEKARIQSPALQDILDSARIVTQTNSESQEKNQKNNVDGDTLHSKKDKPRRIVPTPEEAKALDERLKAREEEKAAQKRKERDEMLKRLVYTSPGFAPYRSVKDNLSSMEDEYGRIPQGESPARDVTVPVSTDGKTKVRHTVRTAMEAEATPKEIIPHIEESIVEGNFNYKQKKNAKTMEAAREWVEQRGDVTKAYEDWISEKNRRLNADMIARGFIIYNNLSNAYVNVKTETERTALREKAISILQDISVMGTVAGQTAQAIRLLKQQSPESQYYALERSVRKLQDGINERYGDKQNDAPKIEIDKERAAKWIQALREGDMELAYDLEEVLFQQIAKQIPKTISDRLNAWRYLSMLGNPKTLIRNAVGNAAFTPVTMAKDQIGALMEKLLPKEQQTKYFGSLHASKEGRALLKFASEDALSSDVQQMMERILREVDLFLHRWRVCVVCSATESCVSSPLSLPHNAIFANTE